ncbi:hypothetical protein [Zooshikella harenae]|uniref:YiaAB two helix domain-containing protein n=1 Tax=Zooshikella harenae TaxID=2827238 RepID=A0ABS5ZJ22_9GAMM|nr:hypothetical protein [Zooshikella harenae]MBU2714079.1 hypothetical protein [Zooshikella harenae]
MKRVEMLGIAVCICLAPGYMYLMHSTGGEIEWFVVAFILAMASFLTLYATVFRRYTEDTEENRDAAMKVIKKAARQAFKDSND